MARFYGVVIVDGPNSEHIVAINQETMTIGSDAESAIRLAGADIEPVHAMLICDLGVDGGISIANTSNTPIRVTQARSVLVTDPATELLPDRVESRRMMFEESFIASGKNRALNNETTLHIGACQLSIRLAPRMVDRQIEEAARRGDTFALQARPTPLADMALAAMEAQEEQAQAPLLVLKPGDEAMVELLAINTIDQVQTINLHQITEVHEDAMTNGATNGNLRAPNWVSFTKQTLNLQHGAQRSTSRSLIVLRPPRLPSSRAGLHRFRITADSDVSSKAVEPQDIVVTLLPYVDIAVRLEQRKMTKWRHGEYYLEIENRSNWPAPLVLNIHNDEDGLDYQVTAAYRDQLLQSQTGAERKAAALNVYPDDSSPTFMVSHIRAGETICAIIRVTPRSRWPLGRSRNYPFTLTLGVDTADRTEPLANLTGSAVGYKYIQDLVANQDRSVTPIAIEAELIQRRIPYWALIVLVLLAVLVIIVVFPNVRRTIGNSINRYGTSSVTAGQQAFTVDGQVVPSATTTLTAPFAATIEKIGIPPEVLPACTPSPAAAIKACRFEQESVVALISIDRAKTALDETIRLLDKTRQDVVRAEDQWRLMKGKADSDLAYTEQVVERLGPAELEQAQQQVQEAQNDLEQTRDEMSQQKKQAEVAQAEAVTKLQTAQRAYEEVRRNLAWVEREGTHPTEQYMVEDELVPRPLTDEEKLQFSTAVSDTEQLVQDAENELALAQHAYEIARDLEVIEVQRAEQALMQAQKQLDVIASGNTTTLVNADRAVREAELSADAAELQGIETLDTALDTAKTAFDQLRKDYPLVMEQFTDEEQRLDDGRLPAETQGVDEEQRLNEVQRTGQLLERSQHLISQSGFEGVDLLQAAIGSVRQLAEQVRNTREIKVPANTRIVDVKVREGDQVEANAPLMVYVEDHPAMTVTVIASVDPDQIADLDPTADITATNSQSQTITMPVTIEQLPSLFDSVGAPITGSQVIRLTAVMTEGLPLYTPVEVNLNVNVACAVPERALIRDATGHHYVDVRRSFLYSLTMNGSFPFIQFNTQKPLLYLDERVPVDVMKQIGNWVEVAQDGLCRAADQQRVVVR